MMLGLNGRGTDLDGTPITVDTFAYMLAHELGRTVAEIEDMPLSEYVGWRAYFTAKNALENLTPGGPT